jgi:hypothetical protein
MKFSAQLHAPEGQTAGKEPPIATEPSLTYDSVCSIFAYFAII